MGEQNSLIKDLKKQVVPEEELKQYASLKLTDNIKVCAHVWTMNDIVKKSSEISL
jgi:hypothetical protein